METGALPMNQGRAWKYVDSREKYSQSGVCTGEVRASKEGEEKRGGGGGRR